MRTEDATFGYLLLAQCRMRYARLVVRPSQADETQRPRSGRYETLFRIAAGGMAEVFAARVSGEAGFEKLVAVKSMLPTVSGDEEFVPL